MNWPLKWEETKCQEAKCKKSVTGEGLVTSDSCYAQDEVREAAVIFNNSEAIVAIL